MITEDMQPAMQGAFPSSLATVDEQGIANVSYISQVFYVDDDHVAISNQFLNKSMRNILATKKATVNIINPGNFKAWYLEMEHVETQAEGELFDAMKMQLDVIASMTGMEGIFKLRSSEVFKVTKVEPTLIN